MTGPRPSRARWSPSPPSTRWWRGWPGSPGPKVRRASWSGSRTGPRRSPSLPAPVPANRWDARRRRGRCASARPGPGAPRPSAASWTGRRAPIPARPSRCRTGREPKTHPDAGLTSRAVGAGRAGRRWWARGQRTGLWLRDYHDLARSASVEPLAGLWDTEVAALCDCAGIPDLGDAGPDRHPARRADPRVLDLVLMARAGILAREHVEAAIGAEGAGLARRPLGRGGGVARFRGPRPVLRARHGVKAAMDSSNGSSSPLARPASGA